MHLRTQHSDPERQLLVVLTLEIFSSLISVLILIKQKSHEFYLQVSYQISILFSFNVPNLICSNLLWRSPIFISAAMFNSFLLIFYFLLNLSALIGYSMPCHDIVLTCSFLHSLIQAYDSVLIDAVANYTESYWRQPEEALVSKL